MYAKKVTLNSELEKAFSIRRDVFVEEQGVSVEDEFDEFDNLVGAAQHILVYYQEKPVGTGRVRWVNGVGKLERICILKSYRQFGLGKLIIKTLETIAQEQGASQFKLHGQTQAEGFYNKLGYYASSDVFMEDGIPHLVMKRELPADSL